MQCSELIERLKNMAMSAVDAENTCDTVKCGDTQKEVRKVAVTMFATPEVIRKAADFGADLLIVHEPLYYRHMDEDRSWETAQEKEKLLSQTGMTVFRFHDYAHACEPDLICEGGLLALDLPGQFKKGDYFAVNRYILDEPIRASALAKRLLDRFGLRQVRLAGDPDAVGRKIACCFGTPGHLEESLAENDFVLTGEISECGIGEMARDYAQFGHAKAVLVLGHIGSEQCGMQLLAERLREMYPETETLYIPSGDVYTYIQ